MRTYGKLVAHGNGTQTSLSAFASPLIQQKWNSQIYASHHFTWRLHF